MFDVPPFTTGFENIYFIFRQNLAFYFIGLIHNLVPYICFRSQFGPLYFKSVTLVPYVLNVTINWSLSSIFFLMPLFFDMWLT
jgi:hypothetical protein